ncbi:sugar phosphate nucleotidyltransferase [Rosenbergiella epipactidis]|uniref:sugar phosphate nucleotidyltransferase n=1 Tax=Rosenbergiella epipactidis TaxID=1544694 RepID=UPI001F4E718A|nr:sugar phosphate nucleotidyltransferase [Rosenbergiella epipactidis]
MLKIITPMMGKELYRNTPDNFFPKVLNEIEGKTIFEYSQEYQKKIDEEFINVYIRPSFANKQYQIDNIIKRVVGENARFINVTDMTAGALCTCLLAAEHWHDDDELIISSADQYLDIDCQAIINLYRQQDVAVGLISFPSVHPKWSYVKRDSSDAIIEVVEKNAVSNEALASFFYFKQASLFFRLATSAIMKSRSTDNIFYLSACINEALLEGVNVSSYKIENNKYFNFYDFDAVKRFNQ